jgi:hypothetical protein
MAGAKRTGLVSSPSGDPAASARKGVKRQQQQMDEEEISDSFTKKSRRGGESTERDGGGGGGTGSSNKEGDPMLKLVMERERVRVIEAYKALQKKRREDSGGRNFSTLD